MVKNEQSRFLFRKDSQEFEKAMERINAWYEQEIIDRPPIRFIAHNADFNESNILEGKKWNYKKEYWFDAEYQVDYFIESIKEQAFLAETFPVFWPNLGPEVYSAYYGSELVYTDVTSYSIPLVQDWNQFSLVKLDTSNEYYKKTEELTMLALEKCSNNFLVGYTDLHPGVDCAAAWRDPQNFCLDLLMEPENAKKLIKQAYRDFKKIFRYFDEILKQHNQLSVTWMAIPSYGTVHIPSCDFSSMISPGQFEEFVLPGLKEEIKGMTHNIYHVDGKGVARHIDQILSLPEINAIQWVQGMGLDQPIMQWKSLIKKIQNAGKSVVVDLKVDELDEFMNEIDPKGIYLCIDATAEMQAGIIEKVNQWR